MPTTTTHRTPDLSHVADPCPYAWVDGGRLYRCVGVLGTTHTHRANRWDGHGQVDAPHQHPAATDTTPAA